MLRAIILVFAGAFAVRAVFAVLTSDTFDADEFVVLNFSRAVANGAVPYRDITFFHPPGLLVLLAALHPVVGFWWPSARLLMMAADSVTAVLVWALARRFFDARTALLAAFLYGISPIALISSVRVGPDPIITLFGMAGVCFLVFSRSRAAAAGAGALLAVAFWTKYPALLFLPVCALVAPRRAGYLALGFLLAAGALFAPFLRVPGAMYQETVTWQAAARQQADLLHRISSLGGYWLLLNFPAVIGLVRARVPLWIRLGYCLGIGFFFTAEAYYHYFAPIVPFAALLAAPVLAGAFARRPRRVVLSGLLLAALWAVDIAGGPAPARLFVSASSISDAELTARLLDRVTPRSGMVLSDQFQYALLAQRTAADGYFWNMSTTTQARTLERALRHVAAVVWTKGEGQYPPGFTSYLRRGKYRVITLKGSTVWLMQPPR